MRITVATPSPGELSALVAALAAWQRPDAPLQLHPGDVGWAWRAGPDAVAASLRVWYTEDEPVALGMLDGPTLLRVAVAPQASAAALVRIAADLGEHDAVLPPGPATVETPEGSPLQAALDDAGWVADEAWTPLRRHLAEPVEPAGVRIVRVGDDDVDARVAVHRAAFPGASFDRAAWATMAAAPAYAAARCLLALDDHDAPVGAVTVWSAGSGRPGLLEPLGVDPAHRGRGIGAALARAAAAALRELGASSADVATPSENVAAVATYRAAGYLPAAERRDRRRP